MQARKWVVAGALLVGSLAARDVQSCQGTAIPLVCPRSIAIAKSVNRVFLRPARSAGLQIPVTVLGSVWWNPLPCPQPTGASFTLELRGTPAPQTVPPTAEFSLGVQDFPAPAPVIPGPQFPAQVLTYAINAGQLDPDLNYTCRVIGTYTVTFNGASSLTATGDTEVCIVEPAPGKAGVPRLDMQLIASTPAARCAPGDQALHFFLVANNDPKSWVDLDVAASGNQTARLPDGADPGAPATNYANGLYSISNPQPGTDAFPLDLIPLDGGDEALLPEPDLGSPAAPVTDTVTLPPMTATVVPLRFRSYGMCKDGSCNEHTLKLTGRFVDGHDTPALACASTLSVVRDEAVPKSPLCRASDQIGTGPLVSAQYSPAQFLDTIGVPIRNGQTFAAGNLAPPAPAAMRLDGQGLPSGNGYPQQAGDSIRLASASSQATWSVSAADTGNGASVKNNVAAVFGSGTSSVPLIADASSPNSFFDVFVSVPLDSILVRDHLTQAIRHQGSLTQFLAGPPPALRIEPQTVRSVGVNCPADTKVISTRPRALVRTFDSRNLDACLRQELRVIDDQGNDVEWTATIDGPGVTLVRPSSTALGDRVQIDTELLALHLVSAQPIKVRTAVNWVDISCPGAVNSPLRVPIVTRVAKAPGSLTAAVDSSQARRLWKKVPVGAESVANVTIRNTTKGVLSFSLLPVSGAEFAYVDPAEDMTLWTLARGQSRTVQVRYTPSAPVGGATKGTHRGVLPIRFCSKKSPTNVKLAGTWIAP